MFSMLVSISSLELFTFLLDQEPVVEVAAPAPKAEKKKKNKDAKDVCFCCARCSSIVSHYCMFCFSGCRRLPRHQHPRLIRRRRRRATRTAETSSSMHCVATFLFRFALSQFALFKQPNQKKNRDRVLHGTTLNDPPTLLKRASWASSSAKRRREESLSVRRVGTSAVL